ncbi:hypothetical protein KEM54_002034 [Ascosphaera aggregata]|nr:hypothetical protein KEM54_002034 [Ascosphaera aggregata]
MSQSYGLISGLRSQILNAPVTVVRSRQLPLRAAAVGLAPKFHGYYRFCSSSGSQAYDIRAPRHRLQNRSLSSTAASQISYSSGLSSSTTKAPDSASPSSLLRRAIAYVSIALVAGLLGFTASSAPVKMRDVVNNLSETKSDVSEINARFYAEADEFVRGIEDTINAHPLVKELRSNPSFHESRPHLDVPTEIRAHNLTAGTLSGVNRITVPPYVFSEEGGKSLVSVSHLGTAVSGHPGIVHGGLLATMLDEGLARCCFPALPNKVGVTANLNIDYRRPAPAGSYFVLRATTTKVEGRKAWVEGHIESLPEEGKEPVVFVEAKALFIEPKNADKIPKIYKVA